MSDQERIDRLEQRMARLETLMRQVLAALPRAGAAPEPPREELPRPLIETPPVAPPSPAVARAGERAAPPLPETGRPIPGIERVAGLDGEQWFGQRGLLAVGVAAVVLAAGYLIKLSFDRGWVSPEMRCVCGALAGFAIGALGWSLTKKGYRQYGPALVGTGAGIIYITLWAACRLYGFLPPVTGIVTMAAVALLLAGAAWVLDAEPLGSVAALGAFLAPLVIGTVDPDADRLLVYLATMGLALGTAAWSKHWRITTLIVGLSFFGIGVVTCKSATPFVALAFGAAGGSAGLALGLKYDWWETRFLSFWGGWGCLAYANDAHTATLVLIAGLALSYPIFEFAFFHDWTWPFEHPAVGARPVLQSLYFYVTPFWLVWAVWELRLTTFDTHEGLPVAIVAAAYLAVALTGPRRPFALVGALGAVIAILWEWHDTLTATGALGILALAYGAHARVGRRRDWNYLALIPTACAIWLLWMIALDHRAADAPAFIDPWARVWWGIIAVTIALATDLSAPDTADEPVHRRGLLWAVAGALLWLGVTSELARFFRLHLADPGSAELAGGLAASVWWVVLAGGLVLFGFRRSLRPPRLAGLWLAGIAVIKVIFVDLSHLDALYRVASVFGLGLVSLLVAWLYHRQAKALAADAPADR